MRIAIVCDWFLSAEGDQLDVGGVPSYIASLASLLSRNGHDLLILQRSQNPFTLVWNSIPVKSWHTETEQARLLQAFHGSLAGPTIYSEFDTIDHTVFRPAIVLQHGIYWDIPFRRFQNGLLQSVLNWKRAFCGIRLSRKLQRKIDLVSKVVTVDTNFQNWMRTMCGWYDFETKWVYVPNFATPYDRAAISSKLCDGARPIRRVLFARRFESFRGALLWARVVRRMAPRRPEVEFCMCGTSGKVIDVSPQVHELLRGVPNVRIYEKAYSEMQQEHFAADIEVVPSLASEGTSLAAVEAMSCGACVVASHVGGLGNLIINNYNGVAVQPVEAMFEAAVAELLMSPERVRSLARNGYRTVVSSLDKAIWEKRLTEIVEEAFSTSMSVKRRAAAPPLTHCVKAGGPVSAEH